MKQCLCVHQTLWWSSSTNKNQMIKVSLYLEVIYGKQPSFVSSVTTINMEYPPVFLMALKHNVCECHLEGFELKLMLCQFLKISSWRLVWLWTHSHGIPNMLYWRQVRRIGRPVLRSISLSGLSGVICSMWHFLVMLENAMWYHVH